MPRATTCKVNGKTIDIGEALQRKRRLTRNMTLDFRCIECGERVRPHNPGEGVSAHFEHHERNPQCSLSDC